MLLPVAMQPRSPFPVVLIAPREADVTPSLGCSPLFESAGRTRGCRAIAVVLTGYGRDAIDGVQAVNTGGGSIIAQDEESSRDLGMPGSAIGTGVVDYVQPLEEIGPLVRELVEQRLEEAAAA